MPNLDDDAMSIKVLRAFVEQLSVKFSADEIKTKLEVSKIGNVLPTLFRLEDAEWLKSEQEEIDPQSTWKERRRLYSLTPKGLQHARDVVAADDVRGGARSQS